MVEIIIGFPNLSFTFKRSLSKLLALKEIVFFLKKGFAQYKPFSLMVPTYFPNNKTTLEVLGFTKINPKKPIKLISVTNIYTGFSC